MRKNVFTVSRRHSASQGRAAVVATALLAMTALASCGDSEEPAASERPESTATGTPINVGFINSDTGAFPVPEVTRAAEAAADYVNSNGGINGHPLVLNTCATDGSPTASTTCAQQFVSDGVELVINGNDIGLDSALPILKKAGITIYGVFGGTAASMDADQVLLSPPLANIYQGHFKFLTGQDPELDNMVWVVPNLGPTVEEAMAPLQAVGERFGVKSVLTTVSPTAPDFTAAVAAAESNDADGIFLALPESQCTPAIRTIRQRGFDGMIFAGTCSQFVTDLGPEAEGVYSLSYLYAYNSLDTITADNKGDVEEYAKVMTDAGLEKDLNSYAPYGFSSVMTLADVLEGVPGDPTSESITKALRSFKGTAFMGGAQDCAARDEMSGANCGDGVAYMQANDDKTQTLVTGEFTSLATN